MHFITLLRHGESEGNSSGLLQGQADNPLTSGFHFDNTGYAQFRYNSTSRQWAVLSLNNQVTNAPTQGADSWQRD